GGPYDLVTTQVDSVRYPAPGGGATDGDTRTVRTRYDWTLRQPTATTIDPDGLAQTTETGYDPSTGLDTSSIPPTDGLHAIGTNPGRGAPAPQPRTTTYYRAGTGSGHAECDNRPEWTDLPCLVDPGSDSGLPTVLTTYDRYEQPRTVL